MRSLWSGAKRSPIFAVALIAAVATPIAAWFWWYSGPAVVPGLVTNFAATFLAFLVALEWERHQRQEDDERAERQRRADDEKLAANELERRRLEARRAFSVVAAELKQLERGVQTV